MKGCLKSTVEDLFTRMIGVLEGTVKIMDLYHNYTIVVTAVLELFVECGRKMLPFLPAVSLVLYAV